MLYQQWHIQRCILIDFGAVLTFDPHIIHILYHTFQAFSNGLFTQSSDSSKAFTALFPEQIVKIHIFTKQTTPQNCGVPTKKGWNCFKMTDHQFLPGPPGCELPPAEEVAMICVSPDIVPPMVTLPPQIAVPSAIVPPIHAVAPVQF